MVSVMQLLWLEALSQPPCTCILSVITLPKHRQNTKKINDQLKDEFYSDISWGIWSDVVTEI